MLIIADIFKQMPSIYLRSSSGVDRHELSQIVSALLDTLLGMLSLDLMYLRLKEAEDPLPR